MNRILFAPIEPLPERYSAQWYPWFMEAFKANGREALVVGDMSTQNEIETGEFLDAYQTNIHKAYQLSEMGNYLKGNPKEPFTVFLMDAWFPGVEALAYIRDVARHPLYICGMLHAGCYDPNDHLSQMGCGAWGRNLEKAWFDLYDELFVATNYHRDLILEEYGQRRARITVVDFPVSGRVVEAEKKRMVVFPHRLAPEKQPGRFDLVRRMYHERYGPDGTVWLRTADCRSQFSDASNFKAWYYERLAEAKVVFSSALQETFGIAMLEGVAHGAWPVAPFRLAYEETLAEHSLYHDLGDACQMIYDILELYDMQPTSRFGPTVDHIVRRLP